MRLATDYQRDEAFERISKIANDKGGELATAINELIAVKDQPESKAKSKAVIDLLNKATTTPDIQKAIQTADQLPKKSQ
jgi:thioredoxin-like negative regulator of GroEL